MSDNKKLISVVVPVFNEELMIEEIYTRVSDVMSSVEEYDYELVFFDDGSTDLSRRKIENLCADDSRVKAVFYGKNFGYSKNIFYCIQQAKGDCAVLLHADLQNPPELIPEFIHQWEKGHNVVVGVKNKSRENKIVYFIRTLFYLIMNVIFSMKLVPHATDFELVDKSVINIIKKSEYPNPFLRSVLAESSGNIKYVKYVQDKRNTGKTKFNISKYYDFAVCGIVNMSKKLPRKLLVAGIIGVLISLVEFFACFIPKLLQSMIADISTGIIIRLTFFFIALITVFISVISEFLVSISDAQNRKPLVTEDKRINY